MKKLILIPIVFLLAGSLYALKYNEVLDYYYDQIGYDLNNEDARILNEFEIKVVRYSYSGMPGSELDLLFIDKDSFNKESVYQKIENADSDSRDALGKVVVKIYNNNFSKRSWQPEINKNLGSQRAAAFQIYRKWVPEDQQIEFKEENFDEIVEFVKTIESEEGSEKRLWLSSIVDGLTNFPIGKRIYLEIEENAEASRLIVMRMVHKLAEMGSLQTGATAEVIERKFNYGTQRNSQYSLKNIRINTEPEGAEIIINGELSGKSPMTIPWLLKGDNSIKITKADYYDIEKTINIDERSRYNYDLSVIPGSFTDINSDEPSVRVALTGVLPEGFKAVLIKSDTGSRRDVKPGNILSVWSGEYTVSFMDSDGTLFEKTYNWNKGDKIKLANERDFPMGKLVLDLKPDGGRITLNNEHLTIADGQMQFDLIVGTYILEYENEGFAPISKEIKIEEDHTLYVEENLKGEAKLTLENPKGRLSSPEYVLTSDEYGSYRAKNGEYYLPEGEWEVKAYINSLGTASSSINLSAGEDSRLEFDSFRRTTISTVASIMFYDRDDPRPDFLFGIRGDSILGKSGGFYTQGMGGYKKSRDEVNEEFRSLIMIQGSLGYAKEWGASLIGAGFGVGPAINYVSVFPDGSDVDTTSRLSLGGEVNAGCWLFGFYFGIAYDFFFTDLLTFEDIDATSDIPASNAFSVVLALKFPINKHPDKTLSSIEELEW